MKQILLIEKARFIAKECIRPLVEFTNNRPMPQRRAEIVHTSPVVIERSLRVKHGLIKLKH